MNVETEDKIKFVVVTLFYFLTYSVFLSPGLLPVQSYTIAFILTSLLFILFVRQLHTFSIPENYFYFLIAASIALRIVFIPLHPIGSDDFYRYLWDGKVLANGINPYMFAPNDPALGFLSSGKIPALVNFPAMKTIYFPLSQVIFLAAYFTGEESFLGLKVLMLFFEIITMYSLYRLLLKLGIDKKYILIYALAPLPVFQLMIDAHVDGFGITFLILALLFYFGEKKILSYIFIGLSMCIKPTIGIIIPLIFLRETELKERLKTLLTPFSVMLILFLPFIFNANPFEALLVFAANWTFNGFVFDIINSFVHNNQSARLISGGLFLISYSLILISRGDFKNKIFDSFLMLLIFSPVVHPWYLLWFAVLIPLAPRWSGVLYISLVSLTAFTILNYKLNGEWKEYWWVLMIEYLPVISFFIYEKIKSMRITRMNSIVDSGAKIP